MTPKNIVQKILEEHIVNGALQPSGDIAIKVDQVLMQDATGTQACMQFEALFQRDGAFTGFEQRSITGAVHVDEGLQDGMMPLLQFERFEMDEVRVPFAIQYVDHNIKQIDERNADDHAFLLTFARRYGIVYSPLGNGICHQVHVERFAKPGSVIIGSDSHTTTSGALAAIALGVGGLEVAAVLAGHPFWLRVPKVVQVVLDGKLQPWVSAKDIILELLRRHKVKWGIEVAGIGGTMILEFTGPGLQTLSVPERATIANMAAELNATAVFPSDERTREFLKIQRREQAWKPLAADPDASYDMSVEIDLTVIEPLVAKPHSPDNVVPVSQIEGTPIAQVCVGSSVNSWYKDLAVVALVLNGCGMPFVKTPEGMRRLQLLVSPGSQQIINVMERLGFMKNLRDAGALVLESACGPCVGMGGAPPSNTNSLRTMNRNFPGRSGTKNDRVYLASPETAAASARFGVITDPRTLGSYPDIGTYTLGRRDFTDHLLVRPLRSKEERKQTRIIRGPHIAPPPLKSSMPDELRGEVIAKFGDSVSTGSISPDGVIVMGKRSHVGDIAKHTFEKEMPSSQGGVSEFYAQAMQVKERGGGFVVAGHTYGQGSSREAAAMVMVELGIHAVLAKSFYRIHRDNLISQGILPLVIPDELYDAVKESDNPTSLEKKLPFVQARQIIALPHVRRELLSESESVTVLLHGHEFRAKHFLNDRERKKILAGGYINYLKQSGK